MDLPNSFSISRAISTCESSRSMPRSVPSTSRRYRSFSPSRISQSVISVLQSAIGVKRNIWGESLGALHFAACGQDRLVIPIRQPESGGAQVIHFLFDRRDHPSPFGFDVDRDGRRHSKSLGSGLDYRLAIINQQDIGGYLRRQPDHFGLSQVQPSA